MACHVVEMSRLLNLPFIVMELPYINATDEQCINHMNCHHSSL